MTVYKSFLLFSVINFKKHCPDSYTFNAAKYFGLLNIIWSDKCL